MQIGFCPFEALCGMAGAFGGHLVGLGVDDAIAHGVDGCHSAAPCVEGKGFVVWAQDVAAKGELLDGQAQLAQEGGGHVALVAQVVYDFGLRNGAAGPEHGYVVFLRVELGDVDRIAYAVVGHDDNEQVFPLCRGFEPVDEMSQAVVEIGKGVGPFVAFDSVVGHLPWFVACQGEEAYVPRLAGRLCHDVLKKGVEGNGVGHAPGVASPHGDGKVGFAVEVLVSSGQQVALGACEVDVAAIEELGVVALFGQCGGYAGQAVHHVLQPHRAHGWHGGISAQCAHGAAVGAEGVGIAAGEPQSFALEALKIGRHAGFSAKRLHELRAHAFHDDDEHVGPFRLESRCGRRLGREAHRLEDLGAAGFVEVVEGCAVVLVALDGGEYAEGGVHGSMVVLHVVGIVGLSYVGRAAPYAAAYADKHERADENHEQCGPQLMGRPLGGHVACGLPQAEAQQRKEEGAHGEEGHFGCRYAFDGSRGLAEVIEDGGVDFEAPVGVEHGIAGEDEPHGDGQDDEVGCMESVPHFF